MGIPSCHTIAIGGTSGKDRKDVFHVCNTCSHYKEIIANDVQRQIDNLPTNLQPGKGRDRNGKERELCDQCQTLIKENKC